MLKQMWKPKPDPHAAIVEVWSKNLRQELDRIIDIIDEYPFIAMDTEFPGIVSRPIHSKSKTDYPYQTMKMNVDMLKLIQLGLSFFDAKGNRPPGTGTWQFNFNFNINKDMFAQDSIDLLGEAGIEFKEHEQRGIDAADFAEMIMMSGLVLNEDMRWISYHGAYDFGYLMRLLTNKSLPSDEDDFFDELTTYFPCFYDVKYLLRHCDVPGGSLSGIAASLGLERTGAEHQAGSDSLLTGHLFFKVRSQYFEDTVNDEKYLGQLFSLGQNVKRKRPTQHASEY